MNINSWFARIEQLGTQPTRPSADRRLLLILCLVLFVPAMFRGLMNPDETRYAEIAREMAASGDWVVPHLNYVPFLEKPPLTSWLTTLSLELFGLRPWTLRLAPVLAAILGVLFTYELGRSVFSRRTGLIGGALLATTAIYYVLAISLVTDMILSALVAGAWWTFWKLYETKGARWLWIVLFWLFTAVACLAKGPLGLALVGVAVGLFIVVRGEWAFIWKIRPFFGALVVIAVNAPWILALHQRDPRLWKFFYIHLHFSALSEESGVLHTEPLYYYVTHFPLVVLPWTLAALAAFVLAVREFIRKGRKEALPGLVWLLCIVIGDFLFLHVSKAKLLTYTLPLVPPLMLLTAEYVQHMNPGRWWVRWQVPALCLVTIIGVPIEIAVEATREELGEVTRMPSFWIAVVGGLTLLAGIFAAAILSLRGRYDRSLIVVGLISVIGFPVAGILAPRVAEHHSGRRLAEEYHALLQAADLVVSEENEDYAIPLAIERRVAIMGRAGELGFGIFIENFPKDSPIPGEPNGIRAHDVDTPYLLDHDKLVEVLESDRLVCVFAPPDEASRLEFLVDGFTVLGTADEVSLGVNRNPSTLPSRPMPDKRE